MVANFTIPEDLANKIQPQDIDPIEEQKKIQAREVQDIKDLRSVIHQITNNKSVIEACKDWALFIKQRNSTHNLYLGYATDVSKYTSLCFFLSDEEEKDSKNYKAHIIDLYYTNNVSIKQYIQWSDIHTAEELNTLVLAALSNKYTTAANKELLENLDKEEK